MTIIKDTTAAMWDCSVSVQGVVIPLLHPEHARISSTTGRAGSLPVRLVRAAARWWRGADPLAQMRRDVASILPEEHAPLVREMTGYELARVWGVWQGACAAWGIITKNAAAEAVVKQWMERTGGAAKSPAPSPTPRQPHASGPGGPKPSSRFTLTNGMTLPSHFDPQGRTFGVPRGGGEAIGSSKNNGASHGGEA